MVASPLTTSLSASFQAAQFVEILHGTTGRGAVRFWSKGTGRSFDSYVRASEAASWAANKSDEVDQYVGLNAFRYRGGPMAGIRTLHVDVDFYNVPQWKRVEPRAVLAAVFSVLATKNIPVPSLATATGRGLQLVWPVNPVANRAAPKAMKAMQEIVKLLAPFGADPACTDLTRVFRLPGTINSKNGRVAELIHASEERHDFDALCLAILGQRPERRPVAPRPKRPRTAKTMRAENRSLAHRRLADLQRLILGRWRGKVPEGFRNVVTHLAAVHIVQLPGDPLENTRQWCVRWTDGHDEDEIKRTAKAAQKTAYRYKGLTIGERLGVTADEVARFGLQTIYAATDTPEAIVERQRARKVETERQRRREAGAKPQSESERRNKPWLALGVSRATYYRQRTQNTRETISCHLHSVSPQAEPVRL